MVALHRGQPQGDVSVLGLAGVAPSGVGQILERRNSLGQPTARDPFNEPNWPSFAATRAPGAQVRLGPADASSCVALSDCITSPGDCQANSRGRNHPIDDLSDPDKPECACRLAPPREAAKGSTGTVTGRGTNLTGGSLFLRISGFQAKVIVLNRLGFHVWQTH